MLGFKDYLEESISWLLISEAKDDLFNTVPIKRDSTISTYDGGTWHDVHSNPSVIPNKLKSPKALEALTNSSEDINRGLRQVANGWMHTPIAKTHLTQAERLSKNFTPENTNRIPLKTYSGIHPDLGKRLQDAGLNSLHHMAAFTSTSTSRRTAEEFATHKINRGVFGKDAPIHVVQFHLKPGTGMSVAATPHSSYSENEVLLDKGTQVEKYKPSQVTKTPHGVPVIVHHLVAHPKKLAVKDYGGELYHHEHGLITKS